MYQNQGDRIIAHHPVPMVVIPSAEHKPYPTVVVSVDDLGRDGFGVACLRPHLLPESVVLGDIHQLILDVFPIEDSGYFALLGFDLESGWERQVMGSWRGARWVGRHPSVLATLSTALAE